MRRLVLTTILALLLPACCIDVPFVPFVVDPTIAANERAAKPMAEAPN